MVKATHVEILLVFTALLFFGLGRFSIAPPNIKTTEILTEDIKKEKDQDKHIVTIITKDCSTGKETTTITEDDTIREKETKRVVDQLYESVTQQTRKTLNISGLAGLDTLDKRLVYGASINKEVLGPVTLGAYGLTNGVLGLSIGINF